jgi:hypothetical protein
MFFEKLTKILPLPEIPVEKPDAEDWVRLDTEFCKLPPDFKEFISSFGTGQVDNFLWILNPFSQNKFLNPLSQLELIRESFHIAEKDFGEKTPALFPNPEGLLPFGITDNGDTIFFKTIGPSSEWSIVVTSPRDPEKDEFLCGFTEWLTGILTRKLKSCCFPEDFPFEKHIFVPYIRP